ncbi:3-oxoacyl-ACP synthase [Lewinellaceae bacterium SD302]|nr:3-oxoacyl-ACP synthase [Lewinellaceae bacterium SD302]
MPNTRIAGVGHHVPENIVTNDDLTKVMDTTDEWIRERTGIEERRYVTRGEDSTTTLAAKASRKAIADAGIQAEDLDFIIFATLSPDYYFPGCGVLLQRELGITKTEIGALDIRNQCTGFVYGLSVADQFIKSGMYKNILLVGAEIHSYGLDFSTAGRSVSVIFGDGAGAVVLQASDDDTGVINTKLHSDGTHAEKLAVLHPGMHANVLINKIDGFDEFLINFDYEDQPYGGLFINNEIVDTKIYAPYMEGQAVFKKAVQKFPEVIMEGLAAAGYGPGDLDMFIPHQANLRISQFVQRLMKLPDDKVYNNIMKYGNTTAASIPIAFSEAIEKGKIKRGDLVSLAAFGSGFTWASALLRY